MPLHANWNHQIKRKINAITPRLSTHAKDLGQRLRSPRLGCTPGRPEAPTAGGPAPLATRFPRRRRHAVLNGHHQKSPLRQGCPVAPSWVRLRCLLVGGFQHLKEHACTIRHAVLGRVTTSRPLRKFTATARTVPVSKGMVCLSEAPSLSILHRVS